MLQRDSRDRSQGEGAASPTSTFWGKLALIGAGALTSAAGGAMVGALPEVHRPEVVVKGDPDVLGVWKEPLPLTLAVHTERLAAEVAAKTFGGPSLSGENEEEVVTLLKKFHEGLRAEVAAGGTSDDRERIRSSPMKVSSDIRFERAVEVSKHTQRLFDIHGTQSETVGPEWREAFAAFTQQLQIYREVASVHSQEYTAP